MFGQAKLTMSEHKIVKKGILSLALATAAMLVTPARASDAACPTSPTAQPLSTAVVGATNGCKYLNANFLTFNVGAEAGTGGGDFPVPAAGATSNEEFTTSGTPIYTLDFQTTGQSTTTACATNSWCVAANSANASQVITYDATAMTGNYYGLTLSDGTVGSDATIRAGDVLTVEEQYCIGGGAIGSCATADLGFIKIAQTTTATGFSAAPVITVCAATLSTGVACTSKTSTTAAVSFVGSNNVTIADTVTLTEVANEGNDIFIDSFDNGFETTPEPSTFVLFGSALVGIVALRIHKRKQQA
jgi:hypothetical protein